MGDWSVVKLGELASDEPGSIAIGPFGSRMKSDVYTASGVPIIRGTNISSTRAWKGDWVYVSDDFADELPNCNVHAGDLVFPHRGSIGEVAIIPGDKPRYMLSTSLMKFRPDHEKVSPLFLFYYFRSDSGRTEIMRYSSQVGTPGIGQPLTSLRQFQVPVPSRGFQERVAGTLAALDDKIDLNRRMNETLESMARAIFKDWFVDFGPTRAKAEGRTPYLAPELWDLFSDALDDNGKPAGWVTQPVNHLFEFNPRETLKRGTCIPYLDMAALPTSGLTSDLPRQRKFKSGSKFRDGDTLFARITPCLENGKTAFVFGLGDAVIGAGSTEFIVIRSKKPLPQAASYLLARDPEFRAHAERSMTGTSGRQRANVAAAGNYEMTTPQTEVPWKALAALVEPLVDGVIANAQESHTLAKTRDLLLPKLMSGEIRLRDAEKVIEAVA